LRTKDGNTFTIWSENPKVKKSAGRLTRVYPKVFELVAWSENCKLYSCLPLGAIVSLFFESV
jgi:hypothetical protein